MGSNNPPAHLSLRNEVSKLLDSWERDRRTASSDLVPVLTSLSEVMERETESFYRSDPDPFDDRHPSISKPDSSLGQLMKVTFEKEGFMLVLVKDYMVRNRDNVPLMTAATRLLYDLMPGLDAANIVKQEEEEGMQEPGIVQWLLTKAETGTEPLKYYCIGLLGAFMEIQGLAEQHKADNVRLHTSLLQQLRQLTGVPDPAIAAAAGGEAAVSLPGQVNGSCHSSSAQSGLPSIAEASCGSSTAASSVTPATGTGTDVSAGGHVFERPFAAFTPKRGHSPTTDSGNSHSFTVPSPVHKKRRISSPNSPASGSLHTESSSSWADLEPLIAGSFCLHPLSQEMQMRLMLQYLSTMGNYQELLTAVFGENVMDVILHLIAVHRNQDIRLAFEALKYQSVLPQEVCPDVLGTRRPAEAAARPDAVRGGDRSCPLPLLPGRHQ